MLTGFELFSMRTPGEVEPLFSLRQDVGAGHSIPVRFIHGGHALIGGTSNGQVNIWDVYSRLKQPLLLRGSFTIPCLVHDANCMVLRPQAIHRLLQ